jgi:hypothetical protein
VSPISKTFPSADIRQPDIAKSVQQLRLESLRMQQPQWKLHTVQTQLGELMDAALHGEPQRIVLPNNDAVVVISEHEYIALKASVKQSAPDFVSYLLAIPKRKRPRVSEQ